MDLSVERLGVAELTAPHPNFGIVYAYITAKQARELVDANNHHLAVNRSMSNTTIDGYRRDMVGKRWHGDNGEGLKFNPQGQLIDGEHRLRALARIADDDYGVNLVVFFGVPDDARKTMDDPRRRSAADEFNMSGGAGKLGTKLTAALRALAIMGSGQGSGGRMTKAALQELYSIHPKMLEAVKEVMDVDKDDQVPVRPAIIAALYYAAKHLMGEPERADDMLSVMRSGDKAYEGDPLHAWREFVIKRNGEGKTRLAEAELMRGTLKAWNLFTKLEALKGRFSVPASQPLVDGLTVHMVFGDMVEGYLVQAPRQAAGEATKQASNEAKAKEPRKVKKDGAAKSAPIQNPGGQDVTASLPPGTALTTTEGQPWETGETPLLQLPAPEANTAEAEAGVEPAAETPVETPEGNDKSRAEEAAKLAAEAKSRRRKASAPVSADGVNAVH